MKTSKKMNGQRADSHTPTELKANFDMGTFFGDVRCIHGHKTRLFNIGRGHYVACYKCRSYVFVGANLMSCWRQENKDIWQENYDSIKGYKEVE